MRTKRLNENFQEYYKDVFVGNSKIRKAGGSYVITIPKSVFEKSELKKGSKVIVFLLKKTKKIFDKANQSEEWVKMNKKDKIMFEAWKEDKEKDEGWE